MGNKSSLSISNKFINLAIAFSFALVTILAAVPRAEAANGMPSWAPRGLNAPFDPTIGMFNFRADNMAKTINSLSNAATSQQNHVFVGDSFMAGWNSKDILGNGTIDRDKTLPYFYRRTLNTALNLPTESGTGLVRPFEVKGGLLGNIPYSDGRWSKPDGLFSKEKGHYVMVSNGKLTFNSAAKGFTPITGTNIALTYQDTGPFSVSVDNGAFVKVNSNKTGAVKRYEVAGLANTTHQITIKVDFGQKVHVIGAEVYSNKGIAAHNIAQGGSKATGGAQDDWSVPGDPSVSMSGAFSPASAYSSAPSTVFITLGGNDLNKNAKNLGAIRDGIWETAQFYKNSDIIIVAEAHGSPGFSTVDIKPLLTMLYQMAYDNNWALWDLEYLTGGYEPMAAQGLTGDTYGHLKPAGYQMLGVKLANFMANVAQ